MPCIMTYKIVSNKVLPKQLSNQKNTHTYTTMMQLEVVAVWVFLLVSIAGLTEGKQGPFIVYCERGMEGMDGMGWQVPMGHKGKGGEAGATGSQGPPGPQGQKGSIAKSVHTKSKFLFQLFYFTSESHQLARRLIWTLLL